MRNLSLALFAIQAFFVVSAFGATAGTYDLKLVSCTDNFTECTFSPVMATGAFDEYYTGGGQLTLGGSGGWSYFPAGTLQYQESPVACPPSYATGECTQVTIPAFTTPLCASYTGYYCSYPTGQTLTSDGGSYVTYSYFCGGGRGGSRTCVKPISGGITVRVQ